MVCLGNICRSPLAEGILKSKVYSHKTFIDSAGTGGYHIGAKPDKRSISVASVNGIDITDQKARKFVVKDFDEFDLIYVMDQLNYQNVIDVMRGKAEPETDGREGLKSLELLIAAYLSARDNRTVSLPLEY